MAYSKSKVNKKARLLMKSSTMDGGEKNYGNPGAAAEQMKYNQSQASQVAKAGCRLKQVSNGSKIAKMGNPYTSNINQEAVKAFPSFTPPMASIQPPKPKGISTQELAKYITKGVSTIPTTPITPITPPTPKKAKPVEEKKKKVRKKKS